MSITALTAHKLGHNRFYLKTANILRDNLHTWFGYQRTGVPYMVDRSSNKPMKENAKLGVLVVLIGLKMTQHVKVILIIVCDVLLFSSTVISVLTCTLCTVVYLFTMKRSAVKKL